MAQIATLPTSDKDELELALKEQNKASKSTARRELLELRDNLLQHVQNRDDGIMGEKALLLS